MATLPPTIHTYHCLCTSLLFASTHRLSSLPRRQGGSLDTALILPLPSSPPGQNLSPSPSPDPESGDEVEDAPETQLQIQQARRLEKAGKDLPEEGYSLLLSMTLDRKPTIIRREDGFERRLLWRCGRCRLVVGYELQGNGELPLDVNGKGKEQTVKVIFLIPAGIMSTDVMMRKEKKVGEEDVELLKEGMSVIHGFE